MIKIVWICHFSNDHIQDILDVRKRVGEFAPWISIGIEEVKKRNDIELHIISPHRWISGTKEFSENNIHYHFFNPGIPFYGRHWPSFFRLDFYTDFYCNRRKIRRLVNKIKPDLVNLHGVENTYYATSIFDLKTYPILITIQGLNSLNSSVSNNKFSKKGIGIEQRILKEFTRFGVRVKFLQKYISELNSKAEFYWFKYPFESRIEPTLNVEKKYDCVFFATVSKEKGIEDLIEAIRIVKQSMPSISLKIIGGCNKEYKQFLLEIIALNKLEENIELLGFLQDHFEVHKLASQAKLSILPTYNDILPGTIIESIKAGIPVIAYAANGVVDFNDDCEVVSLVKVGDISGLAKRIIYLLENTNERETLIANGLKVSKENFNNEAEVSKMVNSYKEILNI